MIERLLGQTPGEFLKLAFTQNLALKLFSIVAAIVLFSLVRGAEDAQQTVFVDVLATVPPADAAKVLVSEVPARVRLTLQGSRSILGSIRREDLDTVQIELNQTDQRYYYFEPDSFGVPAGVTITQITPASIPLTWENRVSRRLEVNVRITGEVRAGLAIAQAPTVRPPRALLEGAENQIGPVSSLDTEPIDVSGLDPGTHVRRVNLSRPPPHASYPEGEAVEVTIEVIPQVEQRELLNLAIEVVGPAGQVRPQRADVVLRGPPSQVTALNADRVIPWVDATDPEQVGTTPVQVQLRGIPEGIDLVRVEPSEVLLIVR